MLAQQTLPLPVLAQSQLDRAELSRCHVCDRTFNAERIAKHQTICEKVHASHRPTFKSEMQRAYLAGGSDGVVLGYGRQHEIARPRLEYSAEMGLQALPWRQRRDQEHLDPTAAEFRRLQRRDITPEDYELLLRLDEAVAPRPGTVLNEADCEKALSSAELATSQLGELCAVCQADLRGGEDLRALRACGHIFHAECIVKWLSTSKAVCPLDGSEVKLDCLPCA